MKKEDKQFGDGLGMLGDGVGALGSGLGKLGSKGFSGVANLAQKGMEKAGSKTSGAGSEEQLSVD